MADGMIILRKIADVWTTHYDNAFYVHFPTEEEAVRKAKESPGVQNCKTAT
jgi:hypothetical protein